MNQRIITYAGKEPEVPGIGPFLRIMEKQLDILEGLMGGPLIINEGTRIRSTGSGCGAGHHTWNIHTPGVCTRCGFTCLHDGQVFVPASSASKDQTHICVECGSNLVKEKK